MVVSPKFLALIQVLLSQSPWVSADVRALRHQYEGMHVHVVPNRGSSPTVLLRESYRAGAKVAKRTLAT